MINLKLIAGLSATAILAAACTTTGNVERNAAAGAALGGLAGGVIGNNVGDGDAKTGAAIGAAVGAAGGAARGRQQDVNSGEGTRLRQNAQGQQLYFDQASNRYYYYGANGNTYWQNGACRTGC